LNVESLFSQIPYLQGIRHMNMSSGQGAYSRVVMP